MPKLVRSNCSEEKGFDEGNRMMGSLFGSATHELDIIHIASSRRACTTHTILNFEKKKV